MAWKALGDWKPLCSTLKNQNYLINVEAIMCGYHMNERAAWVTEQERGEDIWGQPCQGKGILNNEGIGLRFEEEFEKEPWEWN